jgi:thioesterase domain-containing protein
VTVFRARDAWHPLIEGRSPDPTLGWGGQAARVEVIEVPGSHLMTEPPHVRDLAAALSTALAASQQAALGR